MILSDFRNSKYERERLKPVVEAMRTGDHPLVQMEQIHGITSAEAAARLGISERHYRRYKKPGAKIPRHIRLLVDLGAMGKPVRLVYNIDKRIESWLSKQQS